MKLTKPTIAFLLLTLVITLLPLDVRAIDDDFLASLPYDKPVNHNKGYEDFKHKSNVIVFGETYYDDDTMSYLLAANHVVEANELSDQVNLLFFNIFPTGNDDTKYEDLEYTYVFNGGYNLMLDVLQGYALPVVLYVSADGEVTHLSSGEHNQQGIASNIKQLIKLSDDQRDHTNALDLSFNVLADANGRNVEDHKAEIMKRFLEIDKRETVTFDQQPRSTAQHVAGSITSEYMQNALRTLNLVRYLSGLPEVTLDSEYNSDAQHGAVLMRASSYGHYPTQPSDMDNDFYELGYRGTSRGNIAMGYSNLYHAIIHGWMADSDLSNIDRVGHRRWALNPSMSATGFGEFDRMYVMYALDRAATPPEYEAIAYPSGPAFPSELFKGNYPWHVSLNPNIFEKPKLEEVTVTLSGGGKTFVFSHENSSFNGNYFNVDTGGYGIDNSIIFRPSGIEEYSGIYKVQIDGIRTLMGIEVSLNYETTFFNASIKYTEDLPSSWAQEGIERAYQSNLLPESLIMNFNKPITRAEFSHLAVRLYENIKGPIQATVEFSDTSDLNVRKMATLGIVNGTGNGLFSPDDNITREQAAKILDLLLDALGQPQDHRSVHFTDQSDISQWAIEHVNSVSNRGIMGGVGHHRFDPKGLFTREQSMITMLRIYDLIITP